MSIAPVFDPKTWVTLQARAALVGMQVWRSADPEAARTLTIVTAKGTRYSVEALTEAELVNEADRLIRVSESLR